MMNKNLVGLILIILLSYCSQRKDDPTLIQDKLIVKEDNVLQGSIRLKGSVGSELRLEDCFCKQFKDRLVIFHREYGPTFDSGKNRRLFTFVMPDSVDFMFSTSGFGETVKYSFKEKKLILDSSKPSIGQILRGSIQVRGSGLDSEGNELDLELMGNFECVVRDSTYRHDSQSGFKHK